MKSNSENIDLKMYKPLPKVVPRDYLSNNNNNNTNQSIEDLNKIWMNEEHKSYEFQSDSNVNVFDVAAYILQKQGEITTMKLHKLCYYSQAWSLVWDEKPLFNERIEAWANGPVIKSLFAFHQGLYTLNKIIIGNPQKLNQTQKDTIDSVLRYYGDKPTQWLVELTHLEAPWKEARKGLTSSERGNSQITLSSMAEYYSSL